MKFAFELLPGAGADIARPALEVAVVGPRGNVGTLALLDTGAVHNRFGAWVAELAGIDLEDLPVERIAIAGIGAEARTVTCQLVLEDFTWEAPVSFCDPWPFDFQVLGHLGFFRWFRVVIDAADEMLEVIPNQA